MVDVSDKPETPRTATASGRVRMRPETLAAVLEHRLSKGDVFEVARLAGIMAAKKTGDLIPLCHPIGLDGVTLDLGPDGPDGIRILATARVTGRTGVEMEALTAVAVAALTIYDMCKAIDRSMTIEAIALDEKTGGRSGTYRRGDGGGTSTARSGAER
jgi:cyclic pyranopterin phosphate synthase